MVREAAAGPTRKHTKHERGCCYGPRTWLPSYLFEHVEVAGGGDRVGRGRWRRVTRASSGDVTLRAGLGPVAPNSRRYPSEVLYNFCTKPEADAERPAEASEAAVLGADAAEDVCFGARLLPPRRRVALLSGVQRLALLMPRLRLHPHHARYLGTRAQGHKRTRDISA